MPMEILIRNDQKKIRVDSRVFKKQIRRVLEEMGCGEKEISVLLVDDAKMRDLNHRYRNLDAPTDVLSFPQGGGEPGEFISHLLGDVVISVETAQRQAAEHGFSLNEELGLLVIHGLLHLLGFDHERSEKEAERMKQKTWALFEILFPGKKPTDSCNY
ncbi:MAG: rRNA maturation RNase YbeY [Nitrospinaceae bacterium]